MKLKFFLKISFLFLMTFLMLFHSELHLLVFKIFEQKYKKEVKQLIKKGIPEDDLVKFAFAKSYKMENTNDLKWIKKNEFRFKGEMYDVVRKEVLGDSIYLYCIHDFKESELVKNYEKYFEKFIGDNPAKKRELVIQNNSFSRFYTSPDIIRWYNLYPGEEQSFESIEYATSEGFLSNAFPPPKS